MVRHGLRQVSRFLNLAMSALDDHQLELLFAPVVWEYAVIISQLSALGELLDHLDELPGDHFLISSQRSTHRLVHQDIVIVAQACACE